MKNILSRFWPFIVFIVLWAAVSSPYFFRGLVPFPSSYLVTFFPPWNATFGMPVKNNAMPDTISQIYPWKKLTIDTWKAGAIPLWNPYSFSGTAHAANYQSAVFSPLNLLFFLFPFIDAWSISILVQPLFAGAGMYLFLRSLARSKVGATVGAVAFMFCGFITTWMAYGTLGYAAAFLPWALWAVASDFGKKSFFSRIILTLAVALSFLSGHFQISLYVLGAIIAYIIYRSIHSRDIKRAINLICYAIAGLFLAAPQLLLTFDAYLASTRSTSFTKAEVIPWQYLVTLFAPDFYGNPVTRNDWFGHYAEWASYVGVIPLMLSLFAIKKKMTSDRLFFVLLAGVAMLLAYPTPLNDLLFNLKLPALSTSAASRIMILLSFALAGLSAFGLDDLEYFWTKRRVKDLAVFVGVGLVVLGVIWFIILVVKPFPLDKLLIAKRNMMLPSAFSLFGFVLIFLGFLKQRWVRYAVIAGLVALSLFDSYRYVTKWMPFDPREFVYPQEKSLTFLQSHTGVDRVFGNIGNEVGGVFQIPLIEGYDAMYQGRYAEFINAASSGIVKSGDRSVVQFDKYGMYRAEVLELLGVRYIYHRLSDGRNVWAFPYWEYVSDGSMKQVYSDEKYWVYEYIKAYPRAFLASGYAIAASKDEIISTLFAKDFDRRESVVLEKKPLIEPRVGSGSAEIISYKPNSVTIKTESVVPKLLFLSDTFDPGWKATVDGKESPVYRADYNFRAVGVPAGSHTVQFTYFPRAMLWGIVICLFTIIVLFISARVL